MALIARLLTVLFLVAFTGLACTTGAGAAEPPAGNAACTVEGTNGPDILRGGPGDDVICAERGDDVVRGLGGDDYVFAGNGDDVVDGGAGSDHLLGERGADELSGDAGSDFLYGEFGDDALRGGDGRDALYGGPGRDAHSGGAGADHVSGGSGRDSGVPADRAGVPACPSLEAYCEFHLHIDVIERCPSFTASSGDCNGLTSDTNDAWAVPPPKLIRNASFAWTGGNPIRVGYWANFLAKDVAALTGWVPSPNAPQFAVEDGYATRWDHPDVRFYTPLGEAAGKVAGPLYINFVNGRVGADVYLDGYLYRR